MTEKQDVALMAVTARAGLPGRPDERSLAPGTQRQTEHQLRTLVEGVPHLIWRSCDQGQWTWASPQWLAYTGQTQDESHGSGWLDVVHFEDRERIVAAWTAAAKHGELDVEFRVRRARDSKWVWHRTTSLPVRDEFGRIIEWLGSTTDIQLYKELQQRQAESLASAKRYAQELKAEITRREHAEARLHHAAYHDDLTGLCNRAWLMDRFRQLSSDGATQPACSLLFVDLDRFKQVNDGFGHATGDLLLVEVGRRLDACLSGEGMLARLGGDEFAIVAVGTDSMDAAFRLSERIQAAMRRPVAVGTREFSTTCSIGIAHAEAGQCRFADLLRDAGVAMYEAKANGLDSCTVFTTAMRDKAADALALETDLRHALSRGELALHYQPICDANDSAIVGVEALLRWRHGERGDVPASTFIPIAERAGLIRGLGRWVLREACGQMRAWHERYPSLGLYVSLNASGEELRDDQYVAFLRDVLATTGLDPRYLQVEITEGVFLRQTETTGELLEELRAMGVRVALDDFGTGYSSLSYFSRYPVDTLKIDRSFVAEMLTHRRTRAVVEAVITLGHAMELSVVAEGVEGSPQLEALQASACDQVQGHLLGRALPANELEVVLDGQVKGLWPPPNGLARRRPDSVRSTSR